MLLNSDVEDVVTVPGTPVAEGEGEIVMRYEPADYAQGALVSLICSILLLLVVLGSVAFCLRPLLERRRLS